MSTQSAAQSKIESVPLKGRNWLYILSLVLVVIGLGISGYLSYTRLTETAVQCIDSGAFNCELVQSSTYSKIMGIPIAYLGFLTYVVLAALLILQNRIPFLRNYGVMLQFGIILFAFLFSVWLVYLQVFQLEALCPWCLGHEVTMTLLFFITIPRLLRSLR